MAISDKVIELETKKTGRNIVFIVLIAVLAAASVLFAVLWVTKAPAVDPPAVEKISLATSDMYAESLGTEDQVLYKVTPGCRYTVEFDIVLKDNSTTEDTNSILNFECNENVIKILSTQIVNEPSPKCIVEFSVASTAAIGSSMDFVVKSAFTPDTSTLLKIQVEESFAETLDIVSSADGEDPSSPSLKLMPSFRSVRTTNSLGQPISTRVESDTYTLREKEGSTSLSRKYEVVERMVYYEQNSGMHDRNATFVLNLEQLGKLGAFGPSKILQGIDGSGGGKVDQLQVFVAHGWNPSESSYIEIVDGYRDLTTEEISSGKAVASKAANLQFVLKPGTQYCRNAITFNADGAAGKCTIKIVANAFNKSAVKPEIILELEFVSSSTINAVTEIKFTDPYTGKESNEVNFYLGGIGGGRNNVFVLEKYLSVKKGNKTISSSDFRDNDVRLSAAMCDSNGTVTTVADNLNVTNPGSFVISNGFYTKGGAADSYILVTDNDANGFRINKIITVHTVATLDKAETASGESATVTVDAGKNVNADLIYTMSGKHAKDFSRTVDSTLEVTYPTHSEEGTELVAPVFGKDGVTNAENTIVIDSATVTDSGEYVVTPRLTAGTATADNDTFNSQLKFSVGKGVAQGSYMFEFALTPQGLKGENGTYVPDTNDVGRRFYVTVNVTNLATSFEFTSYDFANNENDKYTEFDEATKTLTIAAGTGSGGSTSFTAFALKNLLEFYYDNETPIEPESINANYERVKIEANGAGSSLSEIIDINSGRFIVPRTKKEEVNLTVTLGEFSDTLKIEYYMPIKQLVLTDDTTNTTADTARKVYYNGTEAVSTFPLGNGDYDNFELLSRTGTVIGATKNKTINSGTIKHPERVQLDIVVMWGSTGHVLLEKRVEGNTLYFYDPQGSVQGAIFSVGYTNASSGYNVTVRKDLFELSHKDTGDSSETQKNNRDFQRIMLIYSYKDPLKGDGSIFVCNERNIITNLAELKSSSLVGFTYYDMIRRYDKLEVCYDNWASDESGNVRLREKSAATSAATTLQGKQTYKITQPSGKLFNIYVQGIIEFGNGEKVAVKQSSTEASDLKLKTTSFEFKVVASDITSVKLVWDGDKQGFVASCLEGNEAPYCGYILVAEEGKGATTTQGYLYDYIEVGTSNRKVPITAVRLYTDDSYDEESLIYGDTFYVYKNDIIPDSNTVRIYYEIEYGEYDPTQMNMLDEITATGTANCFNISNRNKVDESNPASVYPKDEHGNITDYSQGIFRGFADFTVIPSATNGEHTISIASTSYDEVGDLVEAEPFYIYVATLIDANSLSATVTVNGERYTASTEAAATTPEITLVYNPDGNNVYDFVFDFDISDNLKVDENWIEFMAGLDSDSTGYFNGYFYDAKNIGYLDNISQKEIIGFRIELNGKSMPRDCLVFAIRQMYPSGFYDLDDDDSDTYYLHFYITIDVPVEQVAIEIGEDTYDNDSLTAESDTFVVTTDGRDSTLSESEKWVEFALAPVFNNGDSDRQPIGAQNWKAVIENASDWADFFKISADGTKLLVNYSKYSTGKGNATLALVLNDDTVLRITLVLETSKQGIRFNTEALAGLTRTDNDDFVYGASVYNLGDGAVDSTASITYSVSEVSGHITATMVDSTTGKVRIVGGEGSFRVTATCGELSVSETVTVAVPVGGEGLKLSVPSVTLINHETPVPYTVTVRVYSAVDGVAPSINDITISATDVVDIAKTKVELDDSSDKSCRTWTVVLTALKSGSASITFGAGNSTAVLGVTVVDVNLVVEPDTGINLFADTTDSVTVNVTVRLDGAGRYALTDVDSLSISADGVFAGKEWSSTSKTIGGRTVYVYSTTVKKSDLTVGTLYNVTASGALIASRTGAGQVRYALTSSAAFSFTATGYAPNDFTVTRGSDTSAVTTLDRASTDTYAINFTARTDAGNVSKTYSAEYSDGTPLAIGADGTFTLTNSSKLGKVTVKLHLGMFGGSWTRTITKEYNVVDSSAVTSSLYFGSTAIASGSTQYIDFTGATNTNTVRLDIPLGTLSGIIGSGDLGKIHVKTALAQVGNATLTGTGANLRYSATFRADKVGTFTFDVYTDAIGGKVYEANQVSVTLAAHEPAFALSGATGSADNYSLALNAGATKQITFSVGSDFTNTVTYEASSSNLSLVSAAVSGNVITLTGAKVETNGTATVSITATVSDGVYKGYKYNFSVNVSVTGVTRPTVTKTKDYTTQAGASGIYDLQQLLEFHDFPTGANTYNITFASFTNVNGVLYSDGRYTAPSAGDCRNGVIIDARYTVRILTGSYMNETIQGSIKITVLPASSSVNFAVDSTWLYPKGSTRISATAGTIPTSDYIVSYEIKTGADTYATESDMGHIAGNTFIAKSKLGAVTLRATITFIQGDFVGHVLHSPEQTVTVGMDTIAFNSGITLKPGESRSLSEISALSLTSVGNAYDFDAVSSDSGVTFGVDSENDCFRLYVSPNANFSGANKQVTLDVTIASNDNSYAGSGTLTLTVTSLSVPEFDPTMSGNVWSATSYNGAQYKLVIKEGGSLVTLGDTDYGTYAARSSFTVTPRTDTAGGKVELEFTMLISGGDYAGSIYDGYEVSVTRIIQVAGEARPTVANVSITPNGGNLTSDGQFSVTVGGPNSDKYEYKRIYSTSDSYIEIDANGRYTLNQDNSNHTVTVYVDIVATLKSGYTGPYEKFTIEGFSKEFTVQRVATSSSLEFTVDYSAGSISYSGNVSGRYNVISMSYSVDKDNFTYVSVAGNTFSLNYANIKSSTRNSVMIVATYTYKTYSYGNEKIESVNIPIVINSDKDDDKYAMYHLPKFVSNPTASRSADSLSGTFTYTAGTNMQVLYFESASQYIEVAGSSFTLKPATTAQTATVKAWYYVTGGIWKGALLDYDFDVPVPALAPLGVTASDGVITANDGYTLTSYSVNAVESANIRIDSSGNYRFLKADVAGTEFAVTVTAQVTSGDYAGLVRTTTVTVTAPALPTLTATAADGVITVNSGFTDVTYTVSSADSDKLSVAANGNYSFISVVDEGDTFTVTVTAKIASGVYAGIERTATATVTATVSLSGSFEAEAGEYNESGEEGSRVHTYDFTYDKTGDYADATVTLTCDTAGVQISGDTVTVSAEDDYDVTVTVNVVVVKNNVRKTFTETVNLTYPKPVVENPEETTGD